VVVLTTGKTTTTGVLAVLADTALTGGNVAAMLAGLRQTGRHGDGGGVVAFPVFTGRS
jgi:hypothetical protein